MPLFRLAWYFHDTACLCFGESQSSIHHRQWIPSRQVISKAAKARRSKLIKEKAKFGKFLEEQMSSDEEFQEPPKEEAGIEALVTLMDNSYAEIARSRYLGGQ